VLRVLLAEAELERVPADIAGHPVVRRHAQAQDKRPGQLILDQNHHGAALRGLPDGERRGRPDIVHYTLLSLLESPLCKQGGLEVAIHTRHGELLRIRPDTRLPRGEQRFAGLMAKVLTEGRSQDKEPLLWMEATCEPAEALQRFATGPVVRLDEGGTPVDGASFAALADGGELTVVLGAFPSGPFSAAWQTAVPTAVAVFPQPLNAWAVAAECCAWFRAARA